jgi:hypothetical protein
MPTYDEHQQLETVIRKVFPKADPKGIHLLLDRAPAGSAALAERVKLACVLLSAGDLRELERCVRQAHCDARDVLYWAFYYQDEPPAHMRPYLKR